jgi:hypothetical protein
MRRDLIGYFSQFRSWKIQSSEMLFSMFGYQLLYKPMLEAKSNIPLIFAIQRNKDVLDKWDETFIKYIFSVDG